jgi:hypothetical protein
VGGAWIKYRVNRGRELVIGETITVRDNVVDGAAHIGTAFIK